MAGYRGIPRDTAGYWERPGDTGRTRSTTGDTAADTGRYGAGSDTGSPDTGRWRRIRGDRGRYGEIAQKIVQTRL